MSRRLLTALSGSAAALVLIVALGFAALHRPDPRADTMPRQNAAQALPGPDPDRDHGPDLGILPLREAAGIAYRRFQGRLIAARLKPPKPAERARGVELVHELKLLTPRRDVLLIRLDAQSGAFLEVAGSGLAEARRRNGDEP